MFGVRRDLQRGLKRSTGFVSLVGGEPSYLYAMNGTSYRCEYCRLEAMPYVKDDNFGKPFRYIGGKKMNTWVSCLYMSFLTGTNGIAGSPKNNFNYNGSTWCDMSSGPCCCGAWHHADDWLYRLTDKWKRNCFKSLKDGRPV